ncbi:MAG: c-type cytochrome [Flavobacterium sp.]
MNKLTYLFIVLLFCLSCEVEKVNNPLENVQKQTLTGKEIFEERCVVCHGSNGKLGFNGAKDLTISKLTLNTIIEQVTNGKNAMAGYKNILSDTEIGLVSEYALSLQK